MKYLDRLRSIIYSGIFVFTFLLHGAWADTAAIRIGAIASLTGVASEHGKNWLEGAQFAVAELRSEGKNVSLLVEDDETNPGKVVSAFHKLANVDKVQGIIGGTFDYLAEAAYPLARQYRLPFLTPSNPPEILSLAARQNPWVFTNALTIQAEKDAVRAFLEKQKVTRVALIYPDIPWGTLHAEMLDKLAADLKIQIVYRNQFPIEGSYQDSIKLDALKVKQIRPDLIFAIHNYQDLDLFLSELDRLKFQAKILTNQHLEKAFELSNHKQAYSQAFGIYPESLLQQSFRGKFKKQFGKDPQVFCAEGYDAAMFLAQSLSRGLNLGDPNTSFEMLGLAGQYHVPTTNRGVVSNKAVIMTTQAGRFEPWRNQKSTN